MALVKPRQVWHFAASHEGKPVGEKEKGSVPQKRILLDCRIPAHAAVGYAAQCLRQR